MPRGTGDRTSRDRGQIIPKGERTYQVRVYLGRVNGKRTYSAKTVHGTFSQAQQALTRALREKDTDTYKPRTQQTLQEFLEFWLKTKDTLSDRTREEYGYRLRLDVYPKFGHLRLDQIKAQHIQELCASMKERGLGGRTRHYTYHLVKQALKKAVRLELIFRNPAELVDAPRIERREMNVLSPEQVHHFLVRTKDDPFYPLWSLLLLTGLRPGEALGLKWADLEGSELRIQRALVKTKRDKYELAEPKTERSRRRVLLPKQAADSLEQHRSWQVRWMMENGVRSEMVFCNQAGNCLDISDVRQRFKKALRDAGLPKIRLYDTRHTHITCLLMAGVHPRVAADRAGHSTTSMTMDVYSHVLPTMQTQAVDQLEKYLSAAAVN